MARLVLNLPSHPTHVYSHVIGRSLSAFRISFVVAGVSSTCLDTICVKVFASLTFMSVFSSTLSDTCLRSVLISLSFLALTLY